MNNVEKISGVQIQRKCDDDYLMIDYQRWMYHEITNNECRVNFVKLKLCAKSSMQNGPKCIPILESESCARLL